MADWSDTEDGDRLEAAALKLLYFCTYQKGDSSNEAALFSDTLARYPNWFVLNDAKGKSDPLKLHSCSCGHFRATGTTSNWPKVIGETRESLRQWAERRRETYLIKECKKCL